MLKFFKKEQQKKKTDFFVLISKSKYFLFLISIKNK